MKRILVLATLIALCYNVTGQIRLVEDIDLGSSGSNPREFVEHDGLLFFRSSLGIQAMDTAENITVATSEAGDGLTVFQGALYFTFNNRLHRLNTPYGNGSTTVDNTVSVFGNLYVFSDELYFGGEFNQVDPLDPDYELMAYDGTSVRLVENESSISLYPRWFVEHMGELYFVGDDVATVNGQPVTAGSIYKSNGTNVELHNFLPTLEIAYLTSFDDTLYFLGRQGTFPEPYNLWYSNATATAGFGDSLSFAFGLVLFDNQLHYFDETNRMLYRMSQLGDFSPVSIEPGTEYPSGGFPILSEKNLFFAGSTNAIGSELYRYERGVVIRLVEDYNEGTGSFTPVYGSFFNNKLYISGDDGTGIGRELHVYEEAKNYFVKVTLSDHTIEDGFYNFDSEIDLRFNLVDENGDEVSESELANYELILNTRENNQLNTATAGKDFEALTDLPLLISTMDNQQDGNRVLERIPDVDTFEADEFFFIDITTNDPNISILDATDGLFQIPVKIIDNEVTSIRLELVQNGAEPTENARLRITSTFANDTGAPMPFSIALSDGSATLNEDYQGINPQPAIAIGDSSVEFNIGVLNNDIEPENEENFFATVSYTGSIDPSRVVIDKADQEVLITDDGDVSASPFDVITGLSGAGAGPNYQINEGESFTLDFNAGATANNGDTYDPEISFSLNGVSTTEDFVFDGSPVIPNTPFIVSSNNPDGSITIEAISDDFLEGDEEYTISITSRDNSKYAIAAPSTFTVTIKDVPPTEPFLVTAYLSLPSGQEDNTIQEGQNFRIYFESDNSQYYDNQSFDVFFSSASSSAEFNKDYTHEDSPTSFVTRYQQDAQEFLEVQVIIDSDDDENEEIVISLQKDPNNRYIWENASADGSVEFRVKVIDEVFNTINVKFDNSGGIEGGFETFSVELSDREGKPWSNHNGLEFSLDFTNEIFDVDIQNAIFNGYINGEAASVDNYKNQDTTALASEPKIKIEPNQSSGVFKVFYPPETEDDDKRDYYSVQISSEDPKFYFDKEKIQAVILDNATTAQYFVNITPGANLRVIPNPTNGENYAPECCLQFSVEEGETFNINLEAEKGVPLFDTEGNVDKTYQVEFILGGDATEEVDFTYDNSGRIITNNDGTGINDLIVNVDNDDLTNERKGNNIGETFEIDFRSRTPQFFINNSYFDFFDSDQEGGLERYLIRQKFKIQIVDVLKIAVFKASETKNRAEENPTINAEFEIELEGDNLTGEPIVINYEIVTSGPNSATPIEDYTIADYDPSLNRGVVTIPNGGRTANIVVQPVNDNKFETDENVVIRLIEGSKYSINNLSSQQIVIKSDDAADYTATIRSGEDNQSREADSNDFAEVIIELDQIPITDIEVEFKISDRTDSQNVIEGLGQDYIIYQEDKETIIPSSDRKVVFKANTDQSKRLFIKALPDDEDENNESVFLQLDFGVNYRPLSTTDAEVILVSSTSDLSSFDPTSITVVAKNPRCPGEDQEGSIFMSNGSPFPFDVNVKGIDGSTYDTTARLDKNDSEDFTQTFEELPVGNYEITFNFTTEDIPEDAFPPRYTVQITAIPEMSAEEQGVNLKTRLGSFTVAGSETYTVETNGRTYIYDFGNSLEHVIEVPLDHGLNSIQISGDVACLGTIKKELLLHQIFIYPNPAEEFVSIISNTLVGHYKLQLFDMNGRLVHLEESTNQTNQTLLVVSQLQKGLYLGRITTAENDAIEFKLIKN